MISYEVFMGLALMGIFMVYGTTRVSGIVDGQNEYWFGSLIPMWGVFTQPLGFVLFFTALVAETKRAPFDAPEGESEIVAGYFLEYSGMRWSAFMLAEYVALVGVASLITTLFFGGYHIPWLTPLGQCSTVAGDYPANYQVFGLHSIFLLVPNTVTLDSAEISL